MLENISIHGYRRFKSYQLDNFKRVNLLVGNNNSGKTSILEGIDLLLAGGDIQGVWETLYRRGELGLVPNTSSSRRVEVAVDICHLFSDHNLVDGSRFFIEGKRNGSAICTNVWAKDASNIKNRQRSLFNEDEDLDQDTLVINWDWGEGLRHIPLDPMNGMTQRRIRWRGADESRRNQTQFITTSSLDPGEVVALLERIMLTDAESDVVRALQIIEPRLERIATVSGHADAPMASGVRGGVIARLKDGGDRVPFGSLGDGMWRLLGIALGLVAVPGGTLLIDEIDTGLHYTVMQKMWRLVLDVAERLDMQVFATTHNRDCWESLAAVAEESELADFAIYRVETERSAAVRFTAAEVAVAAKRGIEVR